MRYRYAMRQILECLAKDGENTSGRIYDLIDTENIAKATFYRAMKKLIQDNIILKQVYSRPSGKPLIFYRINVDAISASDFRYYH